MYDKYTRDPIKNPKSKMEGIVCAVILHVVTSSPSPSPPSCSSPVHGVIIGFGNNLRNANAPSIDACCDACVKQIDCASWTYHNGMCYQHGAVTPTTKVLILFEF